MIIKTSEDWWTLYDYRSKDIDKIFNRVGMNPQVLREFSSDRTDANGRLMARLLNKCWDRAPDSPTIHSWPGWGDLCDLCSEEWVFYESEQEESDG